MIQNFKILIIDEISDKTIGMLTEIGFSCVYMPELDQKSVLDIIHDFQGVILRSKIIADKKFIDTGKSLKFIGRVGAGMETIDVAYAESKGIICLNSPEGNRDAVGEQAIGMLLCLMNNLLKADKEVRNKIWKREENRGSEIKGKTIGIIGYGNMGGAFARKIKNFEAEILAYDKYKFGYSDEFVKESSLEDLFLKADIVSLHVPQTPETIYMANDNFFKSFKKNIIVINTARGKVLNTDDLVKNMKSGKVVGACLDVLEYESFNFQDFMNDNMPDAFNYLCKTDRVVLSPHIAGWTHESKEKLSKILTEKIIKTFAK